MFFKRSIPGLILAATLLTTAAGRAEPGAGVEADLLQMEERKQTDAGLNSRTFQVAGHTDNAPLSGGRFKDNWGLSVMRAREVLAFLVTPTGDKTPGGGLPPNKWSAAGFGDTDPIKPNDSPEGKQ